MGTIYLREKLRCSSLFYRAFISVVCASARVYVQAADQAAGRYQLITLVIGDSDDGICDDVTVGRFEAHPSLASHDRTSSPSLADGADKPHLNQIAKLESRRYRTTDANRAGSVAELLV